jgi:hypothetical protein
MRAQQVHQLQEVGRPICACRPIEQAEIFDRHADPVRGPAARHGVEGGHLLGEGQAVLPGLAAVLAAFRAAFLPLLFTFLSTIRPLPVLAALCRHPPFGSVRDSRPAESP